MVRKERSLDLGQAMSKLLSTQPKCHLWHGMQHPAAVTPSRACLESVQVWQTSPSVAASGPHEDGPTSAAPALEGGRPDTSWVRYLAATAPSRLWRTVANCGCFNVYRRVDQHHTHRLSRAAGLTGSSPAAGFQTPVFRSAFSAISRASSACISATCWPGVRLRVGLEVGLGWSHPQQPPFSAHTMRTRGCSSLLARVTVARHQAQRSKQVACHLMQPESQTRPEQVCDGAYVQRAR